MKFITQIRAVDPLDGELRTWAGPEINAISWSLAEQYLQNNGLGYCKIVGVLHSELPEDGEGLNNETIYHIDN